MHVLAQPVAFITLDSVEPPSMRRAISAKEISAHSQRVIALEIPRDDGREQPLAQGAGSSATALAW